MASKAAMVKEYLAHRHLLHGAPASTMPTDCLWCLSNLTAKAWVDRCTVILLLLVLGIASPFTLVPFSHWYERTFTQSLLSFCFGIMRNNLSCWSSPATLWQKHSHISVAASVNSVFVTAPLRKPSLGSRCSRKNIVPAKHLWAWEQGLTGKQGSITPQDFVCLACTLCQARTSMVPDDTLERSHLPGTYSTFSFVSHFSWSVACGDCSYYGQGFVSSTAVASSTA